jgi:hypothetical protein
MSTVQKFRGICPREQTGVYCFEDLEEAGFISPKAKGKEIGVDPDLFS